MSPDLKDDDYNYIVFEFFMNFSIESMRHAYYENKKKEKESPSDELLHELGYSDEEILNKR